MEAYEDSIVDGAPFGFFFLALDTEFVKIFLHFLARFPGEITFVASTRLLSVRLLVFLFDQDLISLLEHFFKRGFFPFRTGNFCFRCLMAISIGKGNNLVL